MQHNQATPPASISEILNNEQAASYIQVKPSTLNNWRVAGSGPPFCKIGSAVRYRRADVDAWLASKVIKSTSEAS